MNMSHQDDGGRRGGGRQSSNSYSSNVERGRETNFGYIKRKIVSK